MERCQKVPKSQLNFLCQKSSESFCFLLLKSIFCNCDFSIASILKSLYFLKWCSIFDIFLILYPSLENSTTFIAISFIAVNCFSITLIYITCRAGGKWGYCSPQKLFRKDGRNRNRQYIKVHISIPRRPQKFVKISQIFFTLTHLQKPNYFRKQCLFFFFFT